MHPAPALRYPVQRAAAEGWVLLGVIVLGAAPVLAWIHHAAGSAWYGLGIWAVASASALVQWWRTPPGFLHWDRQRWIWNTTKEPAAVQPEILLDVQWALVVLLRSCPPASAGNVCRWVLLQRSHAPKQWLALRRALYAPSSNAPLHSPHRVG
ncbi:hypothetical protein [Candidatus Symbiobacter mobilis]|uniref:Toxin CptA n=1 Tax=Candidatus Symbiobacter mobilis CR TaxID=946483 RepID=U5N5V7_9BURK|nr:hypothetical protein [Candidatus Symbiobacter mobilis]AGX86871.1 hypothetical protein Cenrod_0765 [Candidatus Symbiobacter mobilis CR]